MKQYRSHKIVEAAKVVDSHSADGTSVVLITEDGIRHELPNSRVRATKQDLGYVVVYPDGYKSWSPSKAFEEGYTELGASDFEREMRIEAVRIAFGATLDQGIDRIACADLIYKFLTGQD